ncbi:MAG: hypothetical protein M1822_001945 [Bathelium mastoideum]|nr:MAG: hypothetical protein M1822_001945 [Bathelium mastoideum]
MDPERSWLRASSVSRSDGSRSATPTRRHSHYDQQRSSRGSASSEPRAAQPPGRTWRYSQPVQDGEDDDSIPLNFQNLTEVNGPSPVNPDEERYRRTLEDQRSSEAEEARRSGQSEGFANAGVGLSELLSPVAQQASVTRPMRASPTPAPLDLPPHVLGEHRLSRPWERPPSSPEPPKISRAATEMYTLSSLVLFSILGTLARLGVEWLNFYPGAVVTTSVLWANFGGSLFLGFLAEDRMLFAEEWGRTKRGYQNLRNPKKEHIDPEAAKKAHAATKKQLPLFIGLSTGFCGSFTSFSTFMRDAFLALSNNVPAPLYHPPAAGDAPGTSTTIHRNGGFSFEALLAVFITTIALSVGGLKMGAHLAIFLEPYLPTLPFLPTRRYVEPTVVVLGWGSWIGAVIMSIWPPNVTWRGQALFALVFAPVGTLLRFYASLKLNGLVASFPLGTFAVNMLGTTVLGMSYDLQRVSLRWGAKGVGGGVIGCQVLQGIMDGFCGCLTTVSTWVSELNSLRRTHSYIYGGATLCMGFGLIVAILGSVRWTVGWQDPVCTTTPS